jgi:flagellin-like hook-associated protein FlgL
MALNITINTAVHRAGAQLSVNQSMLQRSFDRIASGKRISTLVEDPGSLAVSMKLQATINRLSGAQNIFKNKIFLLEDQDGLPDAVGKIVDRMRDLKGLATQDPMKSDQDRASYNNQFNDLQEQLFDISQMKFNGVSIFANHGTTDEGENTCGAAIFGSQDQSHEKDNTLTIIIRADVQSGSKVSLHKSPLLSSLTLGVDKTISKHHSDGVTGNLSANPNTITFANESVSGTFNLGQISVGVIAQDIENIALLGSQNIGTHSRLAFNPESLVAPKKTTKRDALGRMVDVGMAEETTNQQSTPFYLKQQRQFYPRPIVIRISS